MANDYQRIAQAIDILHDGVCEQLSLKALAAQMHMSESHLQRLFSRWAGVSPKRFLQALTVDRAAQLLRDKGLSVLDASHELGLSSNSRLYDHFVSLEAVTPGQYKAMGTGLAIAYGVHSTALGWAQIALTEMGICQLELGDDAQTHTALERLRRRWPRARIYPDPLATGAIAERLQDAIRRPRPDKPISLLVQGSNFQIQVWRALLAIAPGRLCSYSDVAAAVGKPSAVRAVASAVAANPVGLFIPCHRVIRRCGALGGYRWGTTRKEALLALEAAQQGN